MRRVMFVPALLFGTGMTVFAGVTLGVTDTGTLALAAVTLGGYLNGLALLANGGKMPVKGFHPGCHSRTHQLLTKRTRLKWLCDIITLPNWMVISLGDVLVYLACVTAWTSCVMEVINHG